MTDPLPPRRVCILGATSAVAEHVARRLAEAGDRLALVGRNTQRLEAIAADLALRGPEPVAVRTADLVGDCDPVALLTEVTRELGGLDAVLIFHGVLGDAQQLRTDVAAARLSLETNFLSPALLALAASQALAASNHPRPVLLAVGSVAGDRGRASNLVYGAAKGGLAVLIQGLAHDFAQNGGKLRAVVVKPGFIDTPMTEGLQKSGPLWSSAEAVAQRIVRAMEAGGAIVYAPGFWRWILLVLRVLPEPVFNRLRL